MSDWCILRTSGRNTLGLADSLNDGGFTAWTPAEKVRVGNHRGKVLAPMLPTFVFAEAELLPNFLALADAVNSPQASGRYPRFSVFRYLDRIPVVADCELEPLRAIEQRDRPKPSASVQFERGDAVVPDCGAWAGMSGVVERRKGKFCMVLFPNSPFSVKIATFLLHPREMAA